MIRLISKTKFTDRGCWIYTGGSTGGKDTSDPYLRISIDGEYHYVHHLGLILAGETVPPNTHTHHDCHIRQCWNPRHVMNTSVKANVDESNGKVELFQPWDTPADDIPF